MAPGGRGVGGGPAPERTRMTPARPRPRPPPARGLPPRIRARDARWTLESLARDRAPRPAPHLPRPRAPDGRKDGWMATGTRKGPLGTPLGLGGRANDATPTPRPRKWRAGRAPFSGPSGWLRSRQWAEVRRPSIRRCLLFSHVPGSQWVGGPFAEACPLPDREAPVPETGPAAASWRVVGLFLQPETLCTGHWDGCPAVLPAAAETRASRRRVHNHMC